MSTVFGYDNNGDYPTASIFESIENIGSLEITKHVATYGTGLAWPDRNSADQGYGDNGWDFGEWSMIENKLVTATGQTWKDKTVLVWTVHPDWFTNYEIMEQDQTLTGLFTFSDCGTATGGINNVHVFDKDVYTDEPLTQIEHVWINPWDPVKMTIPTAPVMPIMCIFDC